MKLRSLAVVAFTCTAIWINACSSGLGNDPGRGKPRPDETPGNKNLATGVDLGISPTHPISAVAAAGFVIPAFGALPERNVALIAFATAAPADNGDGQGTPISRDAVTDTNAASDVFVAALCAQDVERRAFSQSLAGKFRHPRCTTCHSMQATTTAAFTSSLMPHAGPPPGAGFPNNSPETCAPCHVNSTNFPVEGWQAPAASFDMRKDTVAQLADRATRIPAGDSEHFVSDKRVLWALDSGILPRVGGRNGIADDDHDGVFEPEDEDGIPRTVPGGSTRFIREIVDWNESGRVVTTAAAVRDVTLASRANGVAAAGNGASQAPKLVWEPNPTFIASSAASAAATNPVGTVWVVFESEADDLTPGDGNAATDIYLARLQVRVEEGPNGEPLPGGINLVYVPATTLVSARDGTSIAGNGASTSPAVGGASAETIAFESLATDLIDGFNDANAGGTDIFVRRLTQDATTLVSHSIGNVATGGNAASSEPSIDSTGVAVAFTSAASDLIALDSNSVADVFHTRIDSPPPLSMTRSSVTATGAEATGGASHSPSIHVDAAGRMRVAFASAATDMAPSTVAASNVYVFDGATSRTTLLNQRISAIGNAVGDGDASSPYFSPSGALITFVSEAGNIDVLRPDKNKVADVFLIEVGRLDTGDVLPYRASVTTAEGADANGPSLAPRLASFPENDSYGVGVLVYETQATNLGTSDGADVMVAFLNETSGVLADFDAAPLRGAAPLTVSFTDSSTQAPTAWQWDFENDGDFDSTERNPVHVYDAPGRYSVRLQATNATSTGTKIADQLILVVGEIAPDFTASATSGAAPLSVSFTDASTESPMTWQWDFEANGSVDSEVQNPMHVYNQPGTYSVRLTATNEAGSQTTTKTAYITVFDPVLADFSGAPLSGVAPVNVQFADLSTGNATAWAWDFQNDGIVDSTAQNPSFTYSQPGTYGVALTVTGPGGSDTRVRLAYVVVDGPVVANFTANVFGQYNNVPIQFTDLSNGSVTSWAWDFQNDGIVDSTQQNPSFTFTSPGLYTVRLTASGPGGADSEIKPNYVRSVASSITVVREPSKDTSIYSINSSYGNGAGAEIIAGRAIAGLFDLGSRRALLEFDLTTIPSSSTVLSARLRMRCTNPTTPSSGNQIVSLWRVTREWTEGTNSSNVVTGGIVSGSGATWNRAVSGATPVYWNSLGGDFTGLVSQSVTVAGAGLYTWDTNADMITNVQGWVTTPANNHGWILRGNETAGVQTAKLFASSEASVSGDRPQLTVVYRPALPSGTPTASFTASGFSQYTGSPISFTDLSQGAVNAWAWDFQNDGTVDSTQQNPTFTYTVAATYTVRLTASGPNGASSTTRVVTIIPDQESATLDPDADNTIYENLPNNSNGGDTYMVVGRPAGIAGAGTTAPRRGLLRFSLGPNLTGSTILTAQVRLTSNTPTATGSEQISFFRLTSDWIEGTSNASTGQGSAAGVGTTAAGGGATWINRQTSSASPPYSATAWTTQGGDSLATATGTINIDTNNTYLSTSLVADVQAWASGIANNGWLLKSDEGSPATVKRFYTREASILGNRPALLLTFRRPLP